jgi:hypothetical protein
LELYIIDRKTEKYYTYQKKMKQWEKNRGFGNLRFGTEKHRGFMFG